jgi:hypothetical protein
MTLDVDKPADRPATKPTDEIEITPEMIEAGREVLENHYWGDGRYDVTPPVLEEIFLAMFDARPL